MYLHNDGQSGKYIRNKSQNCIIYGTNISPASLLLTVACLIEYYKSSKQKFTNNPCQNRKDRLAVSAQGVT